jgi:dTDP-4-dehydrorhamnose 3,5-epimerase
MELISTSLPGCYTVVPFMATDERGTFVKTFRCDQFSALGLPTDWQEEYYSSSHLGVIRGMHFQTPPFDHEKLVFCVHGAVLDVVLDIRSQSPSYGQSIAVNLDSAKGLGLFIPRGMAHGFLALTENAVMTYKVTSLYAPENDAGIRWNSFGADWGIEKPIVSLRDAAHSDFASFKTPF